MSTQETILTESEKRTPNSQDSPVSTLLPTKSSVKVLSESDNGDLYLKVFLLDNTVNQNKWGIDPATVEENIQSAVGKPLVIYQDRGDEPDRWYWPRKKGQYNHPPWDEKDIEHSYEMQEAFSIGTIEKVMKNNQTGGYWGMVKLKDEGVKKIFRENPTLPFYVSPQIRRLHMAQANAAIRDWVFMHLAIVSTPAFGIQASTQGVCSGDESSCTRNFMNAALAHLPRDSSGKITNCGFCTYNAMKEASQHAVDNEKNGNRTIEHINNLNTSHVTKSANLQIEHSLSDNSNTTHNAVGASVPNAATISENVASMGPTAQTATYSAPTPNGNVSVEHKTYREPTVTTIRPNAPQEAEAGSSNKGADKLALIARIEQEKKNLSQAYNQINKLARDNQRLATERNTFNAELAEMKSYISQQQAMARENEIAEIVYNANLADLVPEEVKEAQIKTFLSIPNITPKQVKEITAPWYSAFDSYIASQRENSHGSAEQVPQFNAPQITANASAAARRQVRLPLGRPQTESEGNTFNASTKRVTGLTTEPAFIRARKIAGIYTPPEEEVGL